MGFACTGGETRPTSGSIRSAMPGRFSTCCCTAPGWSARRVWALAAAASSMCASAPSIVPKTWPTPCSAYAKRFNKYSKQRIHHAHFQRFSPAPVPPAASHCQHFGTPFISTTRPASAPLWPACMRPFPGGRVQRVLRRQGAANPRILALLRELGCGFDCSSIAELVLARQTRRARARRSCSPPSDPFAEEFASGRAGRRLRPEPGRPQPGGQGAADARAGVLFATTPGPEQRRRIIGNPLEAKSGVPHASSTLSRRQPRGAALPPHHAGLEQTRPPLHGADGGDAAASGRLGAGGAGHSPGVHQHGRRPGHPLPPEDEAFDVEALGRQAPGAAGRFPHPPRPRARAAHGKRRYIAGPHGVLVTRAINREDGYRTYIGVDACMSALMRPGMYGAYHHIDVVGETASAANPHDALVECRRLAVRKRQTSSPCSAPCRRWPMAICS